jgi:peroxiredoxin Q/BCP
LSRDSPKANTTFKTKQSLPYPLLCDVKGTLIKSIGLQKAPASTQRGVFVLDKAGKVLAAEPGSPAGTLNVVKKLLEDSPRQNTDTSDIPAGEATSEDKKAADTAAEVADTAEKIDSNEAKSTTA